jgi:hypothetical protein
MSIEICDVMCFLNGTGTIAGKTWTYPGNPVDCGTMERPVLGHVMYKYTIDRSDSQYDVIVSDEPGPGRGERLDLSEIRSSVAAWHAAVERNRKLRVLNPHRTPESLNYLEGALISDIETCTSKY